MCEPGKIGGYVINPEKFNNPDGTQTWMFHIKMDEGLSVPLDKNIDGIKTLAIALSSGHEVIEVTNNSEIQSFSLLDDSSALPGMKQILWECSSEITWASSTEMFFAFTLSKSFKTDRVLAGITKEDGTSSIAIIDGPSTVIDESIPQPPYINITKNISFDGKINTGSLLTVTVTGTLFRELAAVIGVLVEIPCLKNEKHFFQTKKINRDPESNGPVNVMENFYFPVPELLSTNDSIIIKVYSDYIY